MKERQKERKNERKKAGSSENTGNYRVFSSFFQLQWNR
jgi:hypothetical protein